MRGTAPNKRLQPTREKNGARLNRDVRLRHRETTVSTADLRLQGISCETLHGAIYFDTSSWDALAKHDAMRISSSPLKR